MGMIFLGILILMIGSIALFKNEKQVIGEKEQANEKYLAEQMEKLFIPGFYYTMYQQTSVTSKFLEEKLMSMFPISRYVNEKEEQVTEVEDSLTYAMILEMQAKDEERLSEDLLALENSVDTSSEVITETSIEKLRDFQYLLSKYYTVDSTTTINEEQLNVDALLSRDMHLDTSTKGPKVLIFHTHSQESFVDSKAEDAGTSIVGIGKYLAEKLNEKGIETIHHDGIYDLVDGKLDRSKAYELSEIGVREILNQYPSIEVVIDLHRDGVSENLHLVTEVDGKPTAKIMFFNGLSRTKTNGDIAYLKNPYIQDNLSFSFQMQLASENLYPGLARKIYLKGYRYSLHMMPKSLLIEAGAQTNTVQEMKNAMDLLANILYRVLSE